MVSMLRPLEMSVEFENKTYQLGDTIDVTVEMSPSRVVQVRGGTLKLVLEERHAETRMRPRPRVGLAGTMRNSRMGTVHVNPVNYQPMKSLTETYTSYKSKFQVHSATEFLGEATLRPDLPNRYRASVRIQPVSPQRLAESRRLRRDPSESISFHWKLVASVDVRRGYDSIAERELRIRLE